MANPNENEKEMDAEEKWTLMFYFASDNPLAPNVVTQLKALTNAGFHQNVNVLCHFDPQTEGTDTHVFDVNLVNKKIQQARHPDHTYKFWGENDPFIRNLIFDKLWAKEDKNGVENEIREKLGEVLADREKGVVYDAPDPRKHRRNKKRNVDDGKTESGPKESLEAFLEFCVDCYPAEHYMLFFLGHGLIVGNDMFLYDQNAIEHSLSLKDLATVLERFTSLTGDKKLDLVSFHCCSMSSIEVAYELRDSARYMLASQGPAFVGSWPYREILVRLFNDKIAREKGGDQVPTIASSVEKIFEYVLRYSYDFQLAGYSFDLSLCKLDAVDQITFRLNSLSTVLTACLKNSTPFVKEAILLAHWEAQSFWQESYTDLYDFCFCLRRRCEQMAESSEAVATYLNPIAKRCKEIIDALESDGSRGSFLEYHERVGNGTIVRAAFAGPAYQYSHGLSIYFPWAEPVNAQFWNEEYKKKYAFVLTGWAEFLQTYFDTTQRAAVWTEIENSYGKSAVRPPTKEEVVLEEITRRAFNEQGPLNRLAAPLRGEGGKPGADAPLGDGDEKPGGDAGMGSGKPGGDASQGGCDCPGIKNYPSFTRRRTLPEKRDVNARETTSIEFFSYLVELLKQ